jgi:hypothetical protein
VRSKSGEPEEGPTRDRAGVAAPAPASDQRRIRPTQPIVDLAEFVAFLGDFEAMFGPIRKPRRIARGSRYLL